MQERKRGGGVRLWREGWRRGQVKLAGGRLKNGDAAEQPGGPVCHMLPEPSADRACVQHPPQHQVHVVSRYAPLPFGRRSAPAAKPISLSRRGSLVKKRRLESTPHARAAPHTRRKKKKTPSCFKNTFPQNSGATLADNNNAKT